MCKLSWMRLMERVRDIPPKRCHHSLVWWMALFVEVPISIYRPIHIFIIPCKGIYVVAISLSPKRQPFRRFLSSCNFVVPDCQSRCRRCCLFAFPHFSFDVHVVTYYFLCFLILCALCRDCMCVSRYRNALWAHGWNASSPATKVNNHVDEQ